MAIDTQSKRMSVTGAGRPYLRSKLPDAAKDGAWRAAVGNIYNGNSVIFTFIATATGNLISKLAALYGVAFNVNAIFTAPTTVTSLDSLVNLELSDTPNIDNPKTYEAVLRAYEALQILQREQDAVNAAVDERLTALEP